ncbi:MAG: bacillithiol biosynthesis cysteine-adding enzyme BshC [Trueperaceae bacterium]|nr:bacillithiol biosynthesis cysteine-adding enzyme BshC [Trueperaceae bacterium]
MSSSSLSGPDFRTFYQQDKLLKFFSLPSQAIQEALSLERTTVNRAALYTALERYAKKLGASKEVFAQLELLRQPESRAVVTGQQAGLLLGPAYTLSKAVTAINLAKELSTEDRPVVPIFWVASQDHDTEEIDSSYLLDFDETLHYLRLPLPKDTPAARIDLKGAWVNDLLNNLQEANFHEHFLPDVTQLVQEAASQSESFSDWFAGLLYRLLGQHGLIILDPMQPDIAGLFKPLFVQELEEPTVSVTAVNDAAQRLKALGFEPQLGRGEAATNLFIEEQTKEGYRRELLRFDDRGFFTERQTYSKDDLLDRLENDPRILTPAAGLRPISQDFILPTAITVVGPGELRYFAQLRGVYEHHGVAMPLIWDRATATVLEPPVARIMDKFNLSLTDISRFDEAKAAELLELHGYAQAFNEALQVLNEQFQTLLEEIRGIDPTLEGTVQKGEAYFRRTLEILKSKSGNALADRDDTYTNQFDRLEKHLLPNGTPQERLISPFSFFLKFGIEPVIAAFLALPTKGDHAIRI